MAIQDNPQVQQLVQRYEALEFRDKIALQVMSVFVSLLLLYALIWLPVNDYYADSHSRYERNQELLAYLSSTQVEARASGSKGSVMSGQSLLQSVSVMAQQAGINPNRIQPDGEGVSVWFTSVSFNQLMTLIERLAGQGISVKQVTMDREEIPGRVNARLILRGA